MPESRKTNGLLIGGTVVAAAALVVGTFFDLEVSQALYRSDSAWGVFGADYGELPGYIVSMLGVGIFLRMQIYAPEEQGAVTLRKLSFSVGLLVPFFFGGVRVGAYLWEQQEILVGVVFALAVLALIVAIPRDRLRPLVPMSTAVTLLAIINPILIVLVLKALWGRVRFRDLGPGVEEFTNWFVPRGITGNTSFPSGHTALGWMLLPVPVHLRSLIAKPSRARGFIVGVVWAVVIGWGVFVAASRIRVGAHYLTDVSFATLTAFLVTLAISRSRQASQADSLTSQTK